MQRTHVQLAFGLLLATILAGGAPAFAQDADDDFQRTLRELNADIDYGELFREGEKAPADPAQPATGRPAPAGSRTYADPGQTRDPVPERDRTPPPSGDGAQQQLLDTVRDAERITQ